MRAAHALASHIDPRTHWPMRGGAYRRGSGVLKARESALLARDGEAVLQLFAENALVVTSSGRIFIGREQIKIWVQDQTERAQRDEAGPRYQQSAKLSWPGKVYREDW